MIFDSRPSPNQITKSGATAIFGMLLKAAKSGMAIALSIGK